MKLDDEFVWCDFLVRYELMKIDNYLGKIRVLLLRNYPIVLILLRGFFFIPFDVSWFSFEIFRLQSFKFSRKFSFHNKFTKKTYFCLKNDFFRFFFLRLFTRFFLPLYIFLSDQSQWRSLFCVCENFYIFFGEHRKMIEISEFFRIVIWVFYIFMIIFQLFNLRTWGKNN